MTEINKTSLAEKFIHSLEQLVEKENRAALAALRRGLGKTPGEVSQMFPYVASYTSHLSDKQADNYYLVASLFALHQKIWAIDNLPEWQTNFGASFAKLKHNPNASESIEKRFTALLNCRLEDLSSHLRHAVSLLKSHEIAINWLQLLKDLQQWENDNRIVQRRWAKAFWGASTSTQQQDSENTNNQIQPQIS